MATLKSLLQTAIDTRVGQALPKGNAVSVPYATWAQGTDLWAKLNSHDQSYTPPSDGWISFYATSCRTWCIRQSGYLVKLNPKGGDYVYSEGGLIVPVRKGVVVDIFFENALTTSGSVSIQFRPCLQN